MMADIRTAAQREAEAKFLRAGLTRQIREDSFVEGYLAGAAHVTPTREQIERALIGRDFIAGTDAVLALIDKLAAGE